ncbi:MAG: type II secretion system F family protein, partial [bacterium]|nr:type II secretion system F family protein [bacterium]
MPLFSYKAKNNLGRYQSGVIEAPTIDKAAGTVREHGLFVVSLSPKSNFSLPGLSGVRSSVSEQDVANFTRHLSTMLETGLPLTDALGNLETQPNNAFADIVAAIKKDVTGGMSLSAAMSKYPKCFKPIYISMVKAGELSGKVAEGLVRLADTMEKNMELKSKIKGAMIYPIIVVVAMLGVGGVMMTFVIPQISEVYKSFDSALPLPTQILISVSEFTRNYSLLVLAGIIGLVFALRSFKKTKNGEYLINNFMFKLPVFGEINKEVLFATLARTMGTLVGSGIAILDALKISAEVVGNNLYRDSIEDAASQVGKGFPFSLSLRNSNLYPPIFS